jgi:hypothetical protein
MPMLKGSVINEALPPLLSPVSSHYANILYISAEKKLKNLEQSRTVSLDLKTLEQVDTNRSKPKGDDESSSQFNLIASATEVQKEVILLADRIDGRF